MADELLPSQVVTLGKREVAGIVTEAGGGTSHAAILARSRGIPAVSGVRGNSAAGEERRHAGRRRPRRARAGQSRRRDDQRLSQAAARVLRPQGRAGRESRSAGRHGRRARTCELLANINNLADAQAAAAMGASGVGLFRTEYLFLTHPDVPDEEEQLAGLPRDHRGQPESPGDDPHARPGRRQDDSLPGPRARGQSVHGLALDSPVVRASGVLRHADSRHPAGGGQGTGPDEARADDVSDDHHARRDAPRADDGPQGARSSSRPRASRTATCRSA